MTWKRGADELPPRGQTVLAYDDGDYDLVSWSGNLWWVDGENATTRTSPEFWCTLPAPPEAST